MTIIRKYIFFTLLSGTSIFGTPTEKAITSRMFQVNNAIAKGNIIIGEEYVNVKTSIIDEFGIDSGFVYENILFFKESYLLMGDWNKLCTEINTMLDNIIPGRQRDFREEVVKNIWGTSDVFCENYRDQNNPEEVRVNMRSVRLYTNIMGAVVHATEEYLNPRYRVNSLDLEAELRRRRNIEEKIAYIQDLKNAFPTEHPLIQRNLEAILPRLDLSPEERGRIQRTLFSEDRENPLERGMLAEQDMLGELEQPEEQEALQQRVEEELTRIRNEWNQERQAIQEMREEEERQAQLRPAPLEAEAEEAAEEVRPEQLGERDLRRMREEQDRGMRNLFGWLGPNLPEQPENRPAGVVIQRNKMIDHESHTLRANSKHRKKGFFSRIFSFLKRKHRD